MATSEDLLIGKSKATARMRASIAKAAQSEFTVLIEGESGPGKNSSRVRFTARANGVPSRLSA